MQSQNIHIGRLHEPGVEAVYQGMSSLVGHNVMRETGEDRLPWHVLTVLCGRCRKIAKQERLFCGAVVGIGFPQCMRIDSETLHVLLLIYSINQGVPAGPESPAAQGLLEMVYGLPGNSIDHLLVKLRVSF